MSDEKKRTPRDERLKNLYPLMTLSCRFSWSSLLFQLQNGNLLTMCWVGQQHVYRVWDFNTFVDTPRQNGRGHICKPIQLRDGSIVFASELCVEHWPVNSAPLTILERRGRHSYSILEIEPGKVAIARSHLRIFDVATQNIILIANNVHAQDMIQLKDGRLAILSLERLHIRDRLECVMEFSQGGYKVIELQNGWLLSWHEHNICLYDLETRRIKPIRCSRRIYQIIQLQDGRIACRLGYACVWIVDLLNMNNITILKGHTKRITHIMQLRDSRILTESLDFTLRVWYLNDLTKPIVLCGHVYREHIRDDIVRVVELQDGRIVSLSPISMRIWDLDSWTSRQKEDFDMNKKFYLQDVCIKDVQPMICEYLT